MYVHYVCASVCMCAFACERALLCAQFEILDDMYFILVAICVPAQCCRLPSGPHQEVRGPDRVLAPGRNPPLTHATTAVHAGVASIAACAHPSDYIS